MSLADWLPLASTAGLSAAGGWLLRHKSKAEARKADAEAVSLDWTRFEREIGRLDQRIAAQDKEINALKKDRAERELITDKREAENKYLREELGKVKKRLALLEGLFAKFSVDPNTPADMLEQIERLKHVP